ncbi:MAG TPA: tetratricopeptide repeat protein [Bacteroidetes bacterium]|nr:tetratricopeptide repeat protein [Bacteroidota bacterium]
MFKRIAMLFLALAIGWTIALAGITQTPEIDAKMKQLDTLRQQMANAESPEAYDVLLKKYKALEAEIQSLMEAMKADQATRTKAITKYNEGIKDLRARRYSDAVTALQESAKLNPLEPKTFYSLGIAFQRLKKYQDALDAFTQATKLNGNYVRAHTARGLLLSRMKRLDEAVKAFQSAVAVQDASAKDRAKAFNGLGLAYHRQKNDRQAVSAYQQATNLMPEYAEAWFNMGKAYEALKDYASAVDALKKAVEHAPKDYKYHTALAENLNKLSRFSEAASAAARATEINANYAPAWFELGWAYEHLNKSSDAIAAYQKAEKDRNYRQAAEYQIKSIRGEF